MWAPGTVDSNSMCHKPHQAFRSQRVWGDPRLPQVVLPPAPASWSPGREEAAQAGCPIPHLVTQEEPVTVPGRGSIR